MRLLFTCGAYLGNFHPLVPFAQAAAAAGHEVAFATHRSLEPFVARTGSRLFAAGP